MSDELSQRLNQYVNDLFVREDEVLRFVRQQTAAHGLPLINLQPHEGKMIQLLVMLVGAERAVEVGTLAGYSGIWIARGLPAHGKLLTIEHSSKHAKLAQSHFERAGLSDKVTVHQGDGRQILRKLQADAPFDLMFIDADKVNYPHYLDWAVDNLRIGGVVLAHNAFWGGNIFAPDTADGRGVVQFNQTLADHPRFDSSIIEVGDGLALGVKRR